MNREWLDIGGESADDLPVPERMQSLWSEAGDLWDQFEKCSEFKGFVAADYSRVYRALLQLRDQASMFLEWGSGLGVVTIMASMLGFEAYGIEIESRLVEHSRRLAKKYSAGARFVTGSFIPEDYQWNPEFGDGNFRTQFEGESAYRELDLELRDFDLVYAYPWPDEQALFGDILRRSTRQPPLLLLYDAREGVMLARFGRRRGGGRG